MPPIPGCPELPFLQSRQRNALLAPDRHATSFNGCYEAGSVVGLPWPSRLTPIDREFTFN
jgi:hypothetical protein